MGNPSYARGRFEKPSYESKAPLAGWLEIAMSTTLDANEFQAGLQHLDALLRDAERFDEPALLQMREIVRAVLDLHGAALGRLLSHLEAAGESGRSLLATCAGDEVVSGLLLLHGLHPLGLQERVEKALEEVRPRLRSHSGNVELLGIEEGVVRLRLEGNCHGCPSSAATMKQTIEEAIIAKAPDVMGILVEGLVERPPAAPSRTLSLPVLNG
jgi:Fe-S cluster biogenesis protein NfuA